MTVRWVHEDNVWYGWTDKLDMRQDEPDFVVKEVAGDPGQLIWAGWEYDQTGAQSCVTMDWPTAGQAKTDIEHYETRCNLWARAHGLLKEEGQS